MADKINRKTQAASEFTLTIQLTVLPHVGYRFCIGSNKKDKVNASEYDADDHEPKLSFKSKVPI